MRIILVLLLFASGCALNDPTDMTITNIKKVDFKVQDELLSKGNRVIFNPYDTYLRQLSLEKNTISPNDLDAYFENKKIINKLRSAKDSRPLLKVWVTSKVNLLEYLRTNGFLVVVHTYFCNQPEGPFIWDLPNLYLEKLEINSLYNNKYSFDTKEEYVNYYFFVDTKSMITWPSAPGFFDLEAKPVDVCIQLEGGSFPLGSGFKSNVVKISESEIVKLLKKNKEKNNE